MSREPDSRPEPGVTQLEIKHFSHKHPLILKKEHKDETPELSCQACEQPISGVPSYGCLWCKFYLHMSCAELPREITHPLHPKHPLHLGYDTGWCCASCGRTCERFFYACYKCSFCIDTVCLSAKEKIQQTIKHKSHTHPLISLQRPASFFCFACGTVHRGASYLCTTCGFWINQRCASLPSTCSNHHHHHPLALTYSLSDDYIFRVNCDICSEEINRLCWIYCCFGCRYFSHINCATSNTVPSRNCETEAEVEDLNSSLINLPLADQWVDPIALFIKYISIQGKYNKAAEISHFNHDHPLIYVDEKPNGEESCSGSKLLPLLSEVKYDETCNGCARPISAAPFYHCSFCNFFLHECCAELDNELRHPRHTEHPLILMANPTTSFFLRWCSCCLKRCNVFMFGCAACDFYLDIRCASLPHRIRHEAHKGSLGLRKVSNKNCSTCSGNIEGFVFACGICNFTVCDICAMLPSKFRHRYDVHPFSLTYLPIEDHEAEYYCELCEYEIEPKRWFYHCVDCDQSFHPGCTNLLVQNVHLNVKFGGTLKVDKHPHPLTFVPCPKIKRPQPSCDKCGAFFEQHELVFECAPCNFRLHHKCAI